MKDCDILKALNVNYRYSTIGDEDSYLREHKNQGGPIKNKLKVTLAQLKRLHEIDKEVYRVY